MDRIDTRAVITSLRSALYYLDSVWTLHPIEKNIRQALQLVEEHALREGIGLPAHRREMSQVDASVKTQ